MTTSLFEQLISRQQSRDSILVMGVDPHHHLLPDQARPRDGNLQPLADFLFEAIEAAAQDIAAFKVQVAFFEQYGPAGMSLYRDVLLHCRHQGTPVIGDIKRGDIGSTAAGYALSHLGQDAPFPSDVITVNPYLGPDTLEPFAKTAWDKQAGLFVLCRTSNPGSHQLQNEVLSDGQTVFSRIANWCEDLGQSEGPTKIKHCGLVVGCTHPQELAQLREQHPSLPLLIPGLGAQGGSVKDLKATCEVAGPWGLFVNASRSLLFPEQGQVSGSQAIRDAVQKTNDDIRQLWSSI